MEHKKSLLALAAFGIFTGIGLVSAPNASAFTEYFKDADTYRGEGPENMYYIDANKIDIECPSGSATYKVDKNYDSAKPAWFRADETCTSIVFDLNGKTVEDGAITIPGGATVILKDSIGGGSFQNLANHTDAYLDSIVNTQIYGASTKSKVVVENGDFLGSFRNNGHGLDIEIAGGVFSGSNVIFGTMSAIISGGLFNDGLTVGENSMVTINGGTFNKTVSGEGKLTISGGTFSVKPDEKYLNPGYTFYEVDGKYIVDRNFMLTNFFQYMYVGQTNDAYISPAIISKTAKVTSSDENIVGVSCEDSKKLVGQMLIESEDIISKACVITAKKAGKAVLSYTTDYGYEGDITVRVADIDATDYGNDADKAKYELTARYLSVFIADPVKHAWYTTAPSAVGSDYDTYLENLKKQFAGLISAIDDGHKIKLKLDVKEVPVTDEDKELVGKATVYKNGEGLVPVTSTNIAAAYSVSGSILDVTNNKTLVEDWAYGTSRLPIPEILKNRQRAIQIMPVRENTEENQYVYAQDAKIEDGYIVVENMVFRAGNKFIILYDGSVINPDGTTEDVPSVPNSAGFSDENSMTIILGASAALGLIIAVIAIYANGRKKALNKVRF